LYPLKPTWTIKREKPWKKILIFHKKKFKIKSFHKKYHLFFVALKNYYLLNIFCFNLTMNLASSLVNRFFFPSLVWFFVIIIWFVNFSLIFFFIDIKVRTNLIQICLYSFLAVERKSLYLKNKNKKKFTQKKQFEDFFYVAL